MGKSEKMSCGCCFPNSSPWSLLGIEIKIHILVVGLSLAYQCRVWMADRLLVGCAVRKRMDGKLTDGAHGREHRKEIGIIVSEILIGCHKGTGMECWGKYILPGEIHPATKMKQGKDRWHDIYLRTNLTDIGWFYQPWCIDEARNVIAMDGQRCLSGT